MSFNLRIFLLALLFPFCCRAADVAAEKRGVERHVRFLVIRDNRLPRYVTNERGLPVPEPFKPNEVLPAPLAFRLNDQYKPLSLVPNVVSDEIIVRSEEFELAQKASPVGGKNAPPVGAVKAGKGKPPEYVPWLKVRLSDPVTLVCLHLGRSDDWRTPEFTRIALSADPAPGLLPAFNASRFPVFLRCSADSAPVLLAPGSHAFVPWTLQEGRLSLQAAAQVEGKAEVVANARRPVRPGTVPVIFFRNEDPASKKGAVSLGMDDFPLTKSPLAPSGPSSGT